MSLRLAGPPPGPASTAATVDPDQGRDLCRRMASGVCVVTALGPDGPSGLTASSVMAVSVDPMLLAVTATPTSTTLAGIRARGEFAVHLLGEDQQAVAQQFAGSRQAWAKFDGLTVTEWHPPVLDHALAVAVCELQWARPAGDHVLVVGAVRRCDLTAGRPLLWHDSGYHRLAAGRP